MITPKLTVIIPVFNGQQTISGCLNSLMSQTIRNFELIVVDNNSTDQTKSIIDEFKQKDSRIRYIFEAKKSRGAARNAGIKAAQGDVIAMTDCDCIVPSDWLEKITEPITRKKADVVMGTEEDLVNNYWSRHIQEFNDWFHRKQRKGTMAHILDTKNFAIKKSVLQTYLFDSELENLEDYDLSLRLRGKVDVEFHPEIKIGHYHKSNLWSWLKLNFDRGYWAMKIYDKHRDEPFIHGELTYECLNTIKSPLFVFKAVGAFIQKPNPHAFFTMISELGFKSGLYYSQRELLARA